MSQVRIRLLIEFWKDKREDRHLDEFHWIDEDRPRGVASRNAMGHTNQRLTVEWLYIFHEVGRHLASVA